MSAVFMQLFIIEMLRSWLVVKKGHTIKEAEDESFPNYEHLMMMKLWTDDISEKHRKLGNTLMIRSRVRWGIFMSLVAGFYSSPILQICSIAAVQIMYCIHVFSDLKERECFGNWARWLKCKF
jgi:hypothetical protein